MDYTLHQRGRASIDFLSDLRSLSDNYEPRTDERARMAGLDPDKLPDDPAQLQVEVAPVLEADPEFRVLRMCRWFLLVTTSTGASKVPRYCAMSMPSISRTVR